MRKGVSILELVLVMALTVIISGTALVNLTRRKSNTETATVVASIAALLREAQSRSVGQASSTSWGVHFENGTTSFYALFSGTYSTSSRENFYGLPNGIQFVTSTVAQNRYIEMTFTQISGAAQGSSSVAIARTSSPLVSSTITVDPSGAISY